MDKCFYLRSELKERFIKDLTSSERLFFLQTAQESILKKGFPACEDLYHFCYFLTLKERFRSIRAVGNGGVHRVLFVHGMKDMDDAIKLHEERLKDKRKHSPDKKDHEFIEYFSKSL